MRVWDIPVEQLCNKHLIAQHHEIHCIYNIIMQSKKGFAYHPEVMRWRGHIGDLAWIHYDTIQSMKKRGLKHHSKLHQIKSRNGLPKPWQPIEKQKEILRAKGCSCKV